MVNQVINMASRNEMARELQVTDYVLQLSDQQQRAEFESRLVGDKSLQCRVNDEIKLSCLIREAYPDPEISQQAFDQFSQSLTADADSASLTRYFVYPAIAVSIMLSLLLIFLPLTLNQEFETLSNDEMRAIANPDGRLYTVIFAAGVSRQEQSSLAQSLGFVITSRDGGANSVLIMLDKPMSAEQMAQWRKMPQIAFLEKAIRVRS